MRFRISCSEIFFKKEQNIFYAICNLITNVRITLISLLKKIYLHIK